MKPEEIGQMEARLHTVVIRSRDMMSDCERAIAVEEMAGYLLKMNERIKALEYNASYVSDSIRINI